MVDFSDNELPITPKCPWCVSKDNIERKPPTQHRYLTYFVCTNCNADTYGGLWHKSNRRKK